MTSEDPGAGYAPTDEIAIHHASAIRVAQGALARAQAAVDQLPTAERIAERDRWRTELARRREARPGTLL